METWIALACGTLPFEFVKVQLNNIPFWPVGGRRRPSFCIIFHHRLVLALALGLFLLWLWAQCLWRRPTCSKTLTPQLRTGGPGADSDRLPADRPFSIFFAKLFVQLDFHVLPGPRRNTIEISPSPRPVPPIGRSAGRWSPYLAPPAGPEGAISY